MRLFSFQFAVQGGWATVPIYASELSAPEFRAAIVGTAYQLGNLASSASSTIEAKIGAQFPLKDDNGNYIKGKYDYGKVMAILLGAVFAYVLLVVFMGPERKMLTLSAMTVMQWALLQLPIKKISKRVTSIRILRKKKTLILKRKKTLILNLLQKTKILKPLCSHVCFDFDKSLLNI